MSTLPNSGEEGAASAAPSPSSPEDAERLLDAATTPEQAWAIYQISADREGDWRAVKLKAERRYGELLGKPTIGGHRESHVSGTNVASGATRFQQHQARKVAAVDQATFDDYVATPNPTRAGLLRAVGGNAPPRERKRDANTTPAQAMERLRKRVKEVRSKNADVRPRWTLEDTADVAVFVGESRRKSGAAAKLKLYGTARKKDPGKLWDLRYKLMQMVGWLAQLDLLDWGIDQWERGGIYDLYDDLLLLDEWTTRALARAATYIDDDGIREKIRKMKENQTGRTDAEKENIKRRIRALERRLESKLSA